MQAFEVKKKYINCIIINLIIWSNKKIVKTHLGQKPLSHHQHNDRYLKWETFVTT